ncbi:MAG: hypothetical protein AAF492_28755 [Verrucomicrobiota bacterium]
MKFLLFKICLRGALFFTVMNSHAETNDAPEAETIFVDAYLVGYLVDEFSPGADYVRTIVNDPGESGVCIACLFTVTRKADVKRDGEPTAWYDDRGKYFMEQFTFPGYVGTNYWPYRHGKIYRFEISPDELIHFDLFKVSKGRRGVEVGPTAAQYEKRLESLRKSEERMARALKRLPERIKKTRESDEEARKKELRLEAYARYQIRYGKELPALRKEIQKLERKLAARKAKESEP